MERKQNLDIGDSISEVFSIYTEQAGVLLPVAFGLFVIVGIVNGLLLSGSLALFPIAIAVDVVAATLYQGMVVGLVRDVQDGRRDQTVGELISATGPVVGPLILAGLLAGFGIGIGFILLIVPGLILITIWAVVAPVIVIERTGVIEAFGRSRELVRDNGFPVFIVVLAAFAAAIIANLILGAILGAVLSGAAGSIIATILSSTVTAPITALVAAVLYYRLRTIEGGAESAPPPEPPAATLPPEGGPPPA